MILLLLLIIKNVDPIFKRVFRTYDDLNNVVMENVRGIRVVKLFNREDYEIGKLNARTGYSFCLYCKNEIFVL